MGFAEPERSVTNLQLLYDALGNAALVARQAEVALACGDPDLALNNLERCSNTGRCRPVDALPGKRHHQPATVGDARRVAVSDRYPLP